MAGGTLRISLSDLAPNAVRINPVDYLPGKSGYLLLDVGQMTVFLGEYDADCVIVARALAAQLTAAADELDAMLAAKAEPVAPSEAPERCDGLYPVPQTSPPRDEPFEATYRCALPEGHDGPHGSGAEATETPVETPVADMEIF